MFNQQFILQHPCYIVLHTSTTREARMASPQTMEEAPAGNYFIQSPAATEVETASFPWQEGGGTNRLSQRTTPSTAAESPTECQLKKTAPTTWKQDQMQVKPIQI